MNILINQSLLFGNINRYFCVLCFLICWYLIPAYSNAKEKFEVGEFDYLVLSLSWSPQFCAEGNNKTRNPQQCDIKNPQLEKINNGFVIHGLWPQFHNGGFPQFCDFANINKKELIKKYGKYFPSNELLIHQWKKHGSCFSKSPEEYFDKIARAYQMMNILIPDKYYRLSQVVSETPEQITAQFINNIPKLGISAVKSPQKAVLAQCTRDRRFLQEIRICFNKDLEFYDCDKKLLKVSEKSCNPKIIVRPF